jgi:tetratricopeptide (TPR) repeat protein
LTACSVGLANTDLKALVVIVLIWGVWHGLAQVFGVIRIYDVKVGSVSRVTVELDRWLCIAWFGGGIFFSPGRLANLLEVGYSAGLPLLPFAGVHAFQSLWGVATAVITAAFTINWIVQWRRGVPASPVKLPLVVTSLGFWWYAMVWIDNAILGIAIFELFHDVQYLAIAWVFNRNRVDKHYPMAEFVRFLFRPNRLMIALYITLVIAYGYAIHMPALIETEVIKRSLLGLVATSALLHFYYDGFIWKVRERSTRESLGLSGGGSERSSPLHRGLGHSLKWGLFALSLGALMAAQLEGLAPVLEQRRNLVQAVPSAYTHALVGVSLLDAGRIDEATAAFRAAVALQPESGPSHFKLGKALRRSGQLEEAIVHYTIAAELEPDLAKRHAALAASLMEAGYAAKATERFRSAASLETDDPELQEQLASSLLKQGRTEAAIPPLARAAALRADSWEAEYNLARALDAAGRSAEAVGHFQRALEFAPDIWQIHRSFGVSLQRQGARERAAQHLQNARRLQRQSRSERSPLPDPIAASAP